jgi:hypothetical protein
VQPEPAEEDENAPAAQPTPDNRERMKTALENVDMEDEAEPTEEQLEAYFEHAEGVVATEGVDAGYVQDGFGDVKSWF